MDTEERIVDEKSPIHEYILGVLEEIYKEEKDDSNYVYNDRPDSLAIPILVKEGDEHQYANEFAKSQ